MPLQRLAWLFLTLLLSTSAQAQELFIFGDDNYPPVIYLNKQQQTSGVLPQALEYFRKASGDNFTLKLYPWKRAYANAESGKGGVIGLSKTPPRELIFDFSEPIYNDNINVVVLIGSEFAFESLADLSGRKIGAQAGASYGSAVDAAIETQVIKVERDQSHNSRLKKLLHGRIDAAFIGNGQAGLDQLLEADPQLSKSRKRFIVLPNPLSHDPLYLAFPKSMAMQNFLTRFNQALLEGRSKGQLPPLTE